MSRKTHFFGSDWPKFCILKEIFDKILPKSLKISCSYSKSIDLVWSFVKISQNIGNYSQLWGIITKAYPFCQILEGLYPPNPGSTSMMLVEATYLLKEMDMYSVKIQNFSSVKNKVSHILDHFDNAVWQCLYVVIDTLNLGVLLASI